MSRPTRYYEPARITPHERVVRRERGWWSDIYTGTAEDLIAAGVIQSNMVPANVSATWRPRGLKVEPWGENHRGVHLVPGYMNITLRPDGRLTVVLTVGEVEQQRRRRIEKKQAEEREARYEAAKRARLEEAERKKKEEEEEEKRSSTADDVRRHALFMCEVLRRSLANHAEDSIFVFADEDMERINALTEEVAEAIRSAKIVNTQPKRHLSLAWSA